MRNAPGMEAVFTPQWCLLLSWLWLGGGYLATGNQHEHGGGCRSLNRDLTVHHGRTASSPLFMFYFFSSATRGSEKWWKQKEPKMKKEAKEICMGNWETIRNQEMKISSQQGPHNKGKKTVRETGPWGTGPHLLLIYSKALGSLFSSWTASLHLKKKRRATKPTFKV